MDKDNNTRISKGESKNNILKLLADYQGIDIADINVTDSFVDDLHMSPSEFTDFLETLYSKGYNTDKIDLNNIHIVEDIIEFLRSDEEF